MCKRNSRARIGRSEIWGLLAAGAFGLVGCDDSDKPPVTAATSKYEVDGGGDTSSSATSSRPARTAADEAPAADSGDTARANSKPPSRPPRDFSKSDVDRSTKDAVASGAQGSTTPSGKTKSTPAASGKQKSRIAPPDPSQVPDGTAAELLAHLDKVLEVMRPLRSQPVRSQQEFAERQQLCEMRIQIAERVFTGEATDDERLAAARHKVSALADAAQLGASIEKELLQWCGMLAKDKAPQVAKYGRLMQFKLNLGKITPEDSESAAAALAELKDLMTEDADAEVFQAAQTVMFVLQKQGFKNEMREACLLIGNGFKESKSPELAAAAMQFMELATTLELDFGGKIDAVLRGDPDSEQRLLEAAQKLLGERPSPTMLEMMTHATHTLEQSQRNEAAGEILKLVEKAFAGTDPELSEQATQTVTSGRRRLALVGTPLVVEGTLADSSPFDWKAYAGKVVLVHFWTTDSLECLQDLGSVKESCDKFRDQGVEVVTVNLDKSRRALDRFLSLQKLPWPVVVSADPKVAGFDTPIAVHCGVDVIPFIVLVGRDGKVAAVQIRGDALDLKLAALLDTKETPAGKEGAAPTNKLRENGGKKSSQFRPVTSRPASFVAVDEPADKPAAPSAAAPRGGESKPRRSAAETPADPKAATADAPADADDNPYSPRADLTPKELADFILNMRDKPKSIQSRPGFSAAVVEAADRILAAQTADNLQLIAVTAKFDMLHKQACAGDDNADKQLAKFVTAMQADARPKVVAAVRFFQLERKVLEGDVLPVEKVPELLAELKDYYTQEKLDARHLRLASSTVRVINRLEDSDAREQRFVEFGNLFAKATDKELSRYGKKLAKPPETKESELVGKPLELRGATVLGAEFDWSSYRGKVVLVDFWATWCGPCIRELPEVKKLHTQFKDRGFDIVGVSLDKDPDALHEFLARNELPWTTLAGDETQELATKYGVRGIPTMMLVDRDGKVVAVSHSSAQLVSEIEKLLAQK